MTESGFPNQIGLTFASVLLLVDTAFSSPLIQSQMLSLLPEMMLFNLLISKDGVLPACTKVTFLYINSTFLIGR